MRPGVNLGASIGPGFRMSGWTWQPKINDERAVLFVPSGAIFNRRQQPLDRRKAEPYGPVIADLRRQFSNHQWLDLGLVGFREAETFRESRGAVIVFDVPDLVDRTPWAHRRELLRVLPVVELLNERPVAGLAYRLEETEKAGELFALTNGVPGLEGIVGRNIHAPYAQGDSPQMAKARWLKG